MENFRERGRLTVNLPDKYKLIFTIVDEGRAKRLVEGTKEVGAKGGTTFLGEGTMTEEFNTAFDGSIKSDKEVIITLVDEKIVDRVFETIVNTGKLNTPGNGICFVVDVNEVAGIVHLLKKSGKSMKEED